MKTTTERKPRAARKSLSSGATPVVPGKKKTALSALALLDGDGGKPLGPLRQSALEEFQKTGIPSVREENWRFTNLAALKDLSLQPVLEPAAVDGSRLAGHAFAALDGLRLVFVNGRLAPQLSRLKTVEGVEVSSLAKALEKEPNFIQRHFGQASHAYRTPFEWLNTALFRDGALIHVSRDTEVPEPVHLLHLTTGPAGRETTFYPRHLLVLEAGARATVTESYWSFDGGPGLTAPVTELLVGENASVEYIKLQEEGETRFHIATISAKLARSARARIHSMALGARLSRTNIHATLADEWVEAVLNGLYVPRGAQLADHFMIVDHAAPHCDSHEYFNGILSDRAKGVFHGRIIVEPGAQKTDAKQTNKNLLLSDMATADTKPQLEIYADDVKCTHGATVGQLNNDAIFYLRARGIPLEAARRMLIAAFAGEILDRVQYGPAREILRGLVEERLENKGGVSAS